MVQIMETTPMKLDRVGLDAPMVAADAAAYLDVTVDTLDKLVRTEGLPVHRLTSGPKAPRRFYRSDIDGWLKNRCSSETPGDGS